MDYETIIGLEVHSQLLTRSKMYCRCSAEYASTPPNTHVCPVCLGMPGVLPVINREAVKHTIMTALALNCTVADYTKFDRKNYPYPDLMKGYQISQFDAPIGFGGWLTIEVEGQTKKIGITRVHLEEDVAKLIHRNNNDGEAYSLVDVNRSGVPLMEVVGEPDLRSPEEARQYLIKLRGILRYLGVSTANMEEGSFRCDANISIRPENTKEYLSKVEVKNMNSFRAVYRALEYEAKRQRRVAAEGKKLVQETRGWLEAKGKTVSQRSKEYAHDYRYFPEPDLPPLNLDRQWVAEIEATLPELPDAKKERFITEYGLSDYDASQLTTSSEMATYFEDTFITSQDQKLPATRAAKEVGNWLIGPASGIMNAHNVDINGFRERVGPQPLAELIALNVQGVINAPTAKTVLEEMFSTGQKASIIIQERGLTQISDTRELEDQIETVISLHTDAVSDYKAGKLPALKFLVGQVMKASKGRANPQLVGELLQKKLKGK